MSFMWVAIALLGIPLTMCFDCNYKALPNPEKGLRGRCPLISDADYSALKLHGDFSFTLCYGNIVLSDYRESAIPSSVLETISGNLDELRTAGTKPFIRIQYSTNSSGMDTTLDWVEYHLSQLQPIFETHVDIIVWFEAGIIGAWGEWHSSMSGLDNAAGRLAVWNLLHAYLPSKPCMKVLVRTPAFIQELVQSIPASDMEAYGNESLCTEGNRVGFHNDCWMSNWGDLGTYELNGLYDQTAREHWLPYAHNVTKYSIYGGETCVNSDGNVWSELSCSFMINESEVLHATYLNPEWNPLVTEYLQDNCCFEEFVDRLGYRFELGSVSVPDDISPGEKMDYSFTITNTGFGRVSSRRRGYLVLNQLVSSGDMRTMDVNGYVDDWDGVVDVVSDVTGDNGGAVADIESVSIANDDDYIYLRVSFSSVDGGVIPFSSGYFSMFFDLDNNSSTGAGVFGSTVGSDMMLQGSSMYDQRAGSWSEIALDKTPEIVRSASLTEVEIKMSRWWRFADGSLIFGSDTFGVQVGIATTSWAIPEFAPEGNAYLYTVHSEADHVVRQEFDIGQDLRTWGPDDGTIVVSGDVLVPNLFYLPDNSEEDITIALYFPDASSTLHGNQRTSIQLRPGEHSTWNIRSGDNVVATGIPLVVQDRLRSEHPAPRTSQNTTVLYLGADCLQVYFSGKTCTIKDKDTLTIHSDGLLKPMTYSGCARNSWPRKHKSHLTIQSGEFFFNFDVTAGRRRRYGYKMNVLSCPVTRDAASGTALSAVAHHGDSLATLRNFNDVSNTADEFRFVRAVGEGDCLELYFENTTRLLKGDFITIFKDTHLKRRWGRRRYSRNEEQWPTLSNPLRIYSSFFVLRYATEKNTPHPSRHTSVRGYELQINKCV